MNYSIQGFEHFIATFRVFTARKTSAAVMVSSSPKCVSGGLGVTGIEKIFEILSSSAKDLPLIAEQDTILVFDGSGNIKSFVAEISDGLLDNFVGLPVIAVRSMSEIVPRLYF